MIAVNGPTSKASNKNDDSTFHAAIARPVTRSAQCLNYCEPTVNDS